MGDYSAKSHGNKIFASHRMNLGLDANKFGGVENVKQESSDTEKMSSSNITTGLGPLHSRVYANRKERPKGVYRNTIGLHRILGLQCHGLTLHPPRFVRHSSKLKQPGKSAS